MLLLFLRLLCPFSFCCVRAIVFGIFLGWVLPRGSVTEKKKRGILSVAVPQQLRASAKLPTSSLLAPPPSSSPARVPPPLACERGRFFFKLLRPADADSHGFFAISSVAFLVARLSSEKLCKLDPDQPTPDLPRAILNEEELRSRSLAGLVRRGPEKRRR